jgi:predicted dehydrogenase
MAKVSWGVLSTAKIGTNKVIPAMQKGKYSEINAISSRNLDKAKMAAEKLEILKAYGSYEELLADKEIDAVYIPLPNHLHVEWSIKSLEVGKHVLCEKPIGMTYKEAVYLQNEIKKFPKLKVMEAFMYRHHPQTIKSKKLIVDGAIGELRNIHTMFTYYNINPEDIRNQADIGGGGLLDIGCYCISISRFLFGSEPKRLCATIEYDPKLKTDRLVSAVLEFEKGNAVFTCSTQLTSNQYAKVLGTKGKMELEIPFTPMPEDSAKIILQTGEKSEEIIFEPCDQYTLQGDLFSQAILNNTDVFTPFEDALANMKVIDKIIESSKTGKWVDV